MLLRGCGSPGMGMSVKVAGLYLNSAHRSNVNRKGALFPFLFFFLSVLLFLLSVCDT